jgi:hypothetical protein
LEPVAKKRSERWRIVNDYVDAFIAASGIRPRADLGEKMISERRVLVGSRLEDAGERDEDAGCK